MEQEPQTPVLQPPPTGHSFETELLGDTYGLGATVKAFIEKLQQNRMVDPRWVAIAKTHFQEGLSATRRAIMKNDRF